MEVTMQAISHCAPTRCYLNSPRPLRAKNAARQCPSQGHCSWTGKRLQLPTSQVAVGKRKSSLQCAAELTVTDIQKEVDMRRVNILSEALPYLQRFQHKTIVIKYGGAAMKDESLKSRVVKDLVLLSLVGVRPVLVHGGGPEINKWLNRLQIEARFLNGLRVTDKDTMDVVEMVLVGRVNKSIVSLINREGGNAVGISGKDGNLIQARKINDELGFVGDVTRVNTEILDDLLSHGHIPVVATVASDPDGQALNINADIVAGEIAASLGAEKLVLMTDVPGVMMDKNDPNTLLKELSITGCHKLVTQGIIGGGMIPKVSCCIRSLSQGVKATHIIDGRVPHSLLLEVLTDAGIGTMIHG